MAQNIIFPEWLNANSLRNYPIRENASRTDVSGSFTIPNELLVSAQFNYSRDYLDGGFYISKVVVSDSSVRIFISFISSEENAVSREIGSVNIFSDSFEKFSYFSFSGQGEDFAVLGSLGIGDISSTINAGIGEFLFEPSATTFEANTQFVSIPALKTVEVYNADDQLLYRATEILKLKEGDNIKLTYLPSQAGSGDPYGSIRIDAIDGQNLISPSECENVSEVLLPCIKKINGVGPNNDGTIFLVGSDCIDVTDATGANAIELSDTCSESCCGCIELQALTDALEKLKEQEQTIRDLINNTQGQQSELLANIISNL